MTRRRTLLALAVTCLGSVGAHGHPVTAPGFFLSQDARFDPSVQRWLADRSLKLLPLRDGQLYYVVPEDTDPYLEEQQIRYLESLLDEQSLEPDDDRQ